MACANTTKDGWATMHEDTGALLFAFDNAAVDYVSMAAECARRIKEHWGIPVAIVTDAQRVPLVFDQHILVDKSELKDNPKVYSDYEANLQFWNSNRCQAMDLTPFRHTILVDVDLMVLTDDIPRVWEGQDVKLCQSAYSVFDYHPLSTDMQVLSRTNHLPMYWATVVCFDRESKLTQRFFKEWKKALSQYETYAHVYGFVPAPVRNDFAVTIAVHRLLEAIYEHPALTLPYSIPSLMPHSKVLAMEPDCFVVQNYEGGSTAIYSDLHIMNKKSILECLIQQLNQAEAS